MAIQPIRQKWKGTMTDRERFNAQMHYQPFDRSFNMEFGYWDENFTLWEMFRKNGIRNNEEADVFFQFDRLVTIGGKVWLDPPFENRVVRETADTRIIMNGDGLLDLAVNTRMGASNLGQEFFLRSGDAYVPVNRLGSGEEAFYNHVRSADGQYIATNSNNGMAGALFDNYLYTWSGTDLEVVRRAASQPKTEIQVVDSKLITTEYQNVVTIRVQDYSDGVVSGDPIYEAEVNLYDEAALKAAYDAVQALMAFPR